jgi:hypothetical protein
MCQPEMPQLGGPLSAAREGRGIEWLVFFAQMTENDLPLVFLAGASEHQSAHHSIKIVLNI